MTSILPSRRRLAHDQSGFSLLEVLVSATIGLLLMAGVVSMSSVQLTTMQDQTKQADLQGLGRNLMSLFQREVRRAGADPQCTAAFDAIAGASQWHLVLQSDLDGSGAIDGDDEYIAYYYLDDLGEIYRYANDNFEQLISGVDLSGSRLRYFDGDDNEIPSTEFLDADELASIRRIRLELEMSQEARNSDAEDDLQASVSADITLRNRFFMADTNCATPPDNVVMSPGADGLAETLNNAL